MIFKNCNCIRPPCLLSTLNMESNKCLGAKGHTFEANQKHVLLMHDYEQSCERRPAPWLAPLTLFPPIEFIAFIKPLKKWQSTWLHNFKGKNKLAKRWTNERLKSHYYLAVKESSRDEMTNEEALYKGVFEGGHLHKHAFWRERGQLIGGCAPIQMHFTSDFFPKKLL